MQLRSRGRFAFVLACAVTAGLCNAQINATYGTFGAGCPGTGTGLGPMTMMPPAATTNFGGGNAIPFGWTPNKYQQVFLGSELPAAFDIGALSVRQPNVLPFAHGFTVDIEIRMGFTTRDLQTLSTTFADNWNAGTPVLVVPRSLFVFPDQSPVPPTNPAQMLATIPFATAFPWAPAPGQNLLIEIVTHGNSNANLTYGYPLDNMSGTASVIGTPASATVANVTGRRGFGLALGLVEQIHTAVPRLYSTGTPQIDDAIRIRVSQAPPGALELLLLGLSANSSNGQPLPLSLTSYGAPGCTLLVDPADVTVLFADGAGAANHEYTIPNNIYMLGMRIYNQAFVAEPTVNALGFVTTNGGVGVIGNQ